MELKKSNILKLLWSPFRRRRLFGKPELPARMEDDGLVAPVRDGRSPEPSLQNSNGSAKPLDANGSTRINKRLLVHNLSPLSTERALAAALAQDGRQVRKVTIVTDSGTNSGCALVEMASEAQARSAIKAMDGGALDGRAIRVEPAPSNGLLKRTMARPRAHDLRGPLS